MTISLGYGYPITYFNGIECLAIGGKTQTVISKLEILSVSQRGSNPCIVDVVFRAKGDGKYRWIPEYCAFSVDTTDGRNGAWHTLIPIETDPKHTGPEFLIRNEIIGTFVFNGCDHISTFFSENKLTVRLTMEWVEDLPENLNLPTTGGGIPGQFLAPGGSVTPGYRLPANG
jgi:hypothetical protein